MEGYTLACFIGAVAGCSIFVLYLVSLLVQWVWSIIDETPIDKYNWFVHIVCKMWGYKLGGHMHDGSGTYTHVAPDGTDSDGELPCFSLVAILFLTPPTVLASIQFYPIALTIGTTIGIVLLARFSRRTFKRLTKHESNPNAHKE